MILGGIRIAGYTFAISNLSLFHNLKTGSWFAPSGLFYTLPVLLVNPCFQGRDNTL